MRILHVCAFHERAVAKGGVAIATGSLARAQARVGADVTVFTTNAGVDTAAFRAMDVDNGVNPRCFPVGTLPSFYSSKMMQELRDSIHQFDIVHLHGLWNFPVNCAAIIAARAGVPYVLSPEGMLNEWAFRYRGWKKLPVWHLFQRHIVRRASCLIFSSDGERRQALGLLRHPSTKVLPLAVEAINVRVNGVQRGSFRARLGIEDGVPLLAFLGRIHPVKGLGVLLEAVQRAPASVPQLQVVIAGPDDGGYLLQLQQQARNFGIAQRVHWVGLLGIKEKWALLQDADLFVLVSFSENFGLAAVEAMSVGTPVVVGEGVNIASIIRKHDAGWVVATEAGAIAEAIREAFGAPAIRRRRAQNAANLVRSQLDPDKVARDSLEAYQQFLRGPNTAAGTSFDPNGEFA